MFAVFAGTLIRHDVALLVRRRHEDEEMRDNQITSYAEEGIKSSKPTGSHQIVE
jgi:hypothetical protein